MTPYLVLRNELAKLLKTPIRLQFEDFQNRQQVHKGSDAQGPLSACSMFLHDQSVGWAVDIRFNPTNMMSPGPWGKAPCLR